MSIIHESVRAEAVVPVNNRQLQFLKFLRLKRCLGPDTLHNRRLRGRNQRFQIVGI